MLIKSFHWNKEVNKAAHQPFEDTKEVLILDFPEKLWLAACNEQKKKTIVHAQQDLNLKISKIQVGIPLHWLMEGKQYTSLIH